MLEPLILELLPFNPYEIALALLGLLAVVAAWLPTRLFGNHSLLPLIYLGGGAVIFQLFELSLPLPGQQRLLWERLTELVVIISLLGAGLKIDTRLGRRRWSAPARLLLLTMPLTIAAVAGLGYLLLGLPLAAAVLLGAVVSPTDPVLASDVQTGPPNDTREHPVRFALTAEAGLNDGLAFPFVYLAITLAGLGAGDSDWLWGWVWHDVGYRIAVGTIVGAALGWATGWLVYRRPVARPLADRGIGGLAIALVLLAYGGAEMLGGYGFIAAFMSGFTLRRAGFRHRYNEVLHNFSVTIEQTLTALLLVLLGGISPLLVDALNWPAVALALAAVLVVRPAAGVLGLVGCCGRWSERLAVAFYGIRGIGSVYYLAYALGHAEFHRADLLWATVVLVIWVSSTVHGLSAPVVMQWLEGKGPRCRH